MLFPIFLISVCILYLGDSNPKLIQEFITNLGQHNVGYFMANYLKFKIGIALFALSNFTRNSTVEAGLYIIDKYDMTTVEIHHIGNRLGKGRGIKQ